MLNNIVFRAVQLLPLLLMTSSMARAALIVDSHAVFGNGSITHDTATNLRWLDLTFSTDLSFNSVNSQMSVGGTFSGFRYATLAEVDQLFLNAGFTSTDGQYRDVDYNAAQSLLNLMGVTSASSRGSDGLGLVNTFNPFNNTPYILSYGFQIPPFSNPSAGVALGQVGITNGASPSLGRNDFNPFTGSFLVEVAAVPEPSSVMMVVLASIGSLVCRKRRNSKRR